MKTCTGPCGETKPLADYHRQKHSHDGHKARCKACINDGCRDYRERNRDAIRARDRARHRLGTSPRVHVVHGCNYPGCRRSMVTDGLCDVHHDEVSKSRESPLALVGGDWVRVGSVMRWVA